jgi:hypothetical protein
LTPEMYFGILGSIIMRLRMINLILIIDLCNFQFSPSILKIYSLLPELWKNYNLVLGMEIEILDRIEDRLWVKFQYGYVFITITVWSSNFDKIMF